MFGLLNVNKPVGWTSREIVNNVSKFVGRRIKVGHAGTLDPLASGVLVLCVGPATRLVPWIHDHLKTYVATFQLGMKSDTEDVEGVVEAAAVPFPITPDMIEKILPEFVGHIQQVPPAFSALRVDGKRAYDLARAGQKVELEPREVYIKSLSVREYHFPFLTLEIECGTGTYIRSLGRDLARRVGTEAIMTALERTRVGSFTVDQAIEFATISRETLPVAVQSPISLLEHLPQVTVSPGDARRMICGQSLPLPAAGDFPAESEVAILKEDTSLLAIAKIQNGKMSPQSVFLSKE